MWLALSLTKSQNIEALPPWSTASRVHGCIPVLAGWSVYNKEVRVMRAGQDEVLRKSQAIFKAHSFEMRQPFIVAALCFHTPQLESRSGNSGGSPEMLHVTHTKALGPHPGNCPNMG
jgi:hypothetical protein